MIKLTISRNQFLKKKQKKTGESSVKEDMMERRLIQRIGLTTIFKKSVRDLGNRDVFSACGISRYLVGCFRRLETKEHGKFTEIKTLDEREKRGEDNR